MPIPNCGPIAHPAHGVSSPSFHPDLIQMEARLWVDAGWETALCHPVRRLGLLASQSPLRTRLHIHSRMSSWIIHPSNVKGEKLLEGGWMMSCFHPLLHTSELATYKWIQFARMDVQICRCALWQRKLCGVSELRVLHHFGAICRFFFESIWCTFESI